MSESRLPSWFAWVVVFALVGGPLGMVYLAGGGNYNQAIVWIIFVIAVAAGCYRWAIRDSH